MKNTVLIIFLSSCFLLMNAQDDQTSLTKELIQLQATSTLPGFSVALVNAEGILYENAFGLSDVDAKTKFQTSTVENLGSVTKTIVGLALVKAIQEGKLTLDTPINDILPFPVVNPRSKNTPILIRHLANHTSSILDTKHYGKSYVADSDIENKGEIHQGYLEFISKHEEMPLKDFLFNILHVDGAWYKKQNFLKAEPGSERNYANLNAALTAFIIETTTGKSFKTYTQETIFTPLGMTHTDWDLTDEMKQKLATPYFPSMMVVPRYKLITYPDGGLYSNAEDLSILLQEMIKAYSGKSDYLPLTFAQMLLPGDEDDNRAFWGMGQESRNIGHGGSDPGVQTDMQFHADRKIGRIILSNINAEDSPMVWEFYRQIHKILAKYEDQLSR